MVCDLRTRLAAAEDKLDKAESAVGQIVDVANRHGWNGVENSKLLWVFLDTELQDLAELKQRIAASPVAWVQFGNHNNPCEISEDRETFWAGEHPPGTLRKCRLLEVRDGE